MPNPILDDPQDLDDQSNGKTSARYWLVAGMGMAILLLANNLRDIYYPLPEYMFADSVAKFPVNGLILFSIYTLGTVLHMEALLRSTPRPGRAEAVKNAFFSGLLAICAFKSVQLFVSLSLNSLRLEEVLDIAFFSVYCAVIAFLWYSFRQKKGCLPGLLFFAGSVAAGKFVVDQLLPFL
jgi:hypothetical protein